MKRTAKTAFIVTIGIFMLIAAGCEEEEMSVVRKGRLVVLENEKIKKELESCQKKNEEQKEQFEKELEKQRGNLENKLEDCLDKKRVLEGTTEKYMEKQLNSILKDVVDENAKLRQENEGLKAELEQLKAEKDK